MCKVWFVCHFFSFTHVDTYDWAEQLFCACSRVYRSELLLAHEPEQCGLSRASFSLSHSPSIPCWPWCLWGGRAWPTSTTLTAERTSAISWQIQGPDFLLCQPPLFTRTELRVLVGNLFLAVCPTVQRSGTAGSANRLRGTKRICMCEVTISTQGLSTQPGESLAAGQPSSGF